MAHSLEMLWHGKYHDIPLDGLALYNRELVYFNCVDEGGWVDIKDCPKVLADMISSQVEKEYEFEWEDYCVWKYVFEWEDTLEINKKPCYNIYRMPLNLLMEYENYIMEFSEKVGYHCWSNDKYKPFNANNGTWRDYYKMCIPININVEDCELLGSFSSKDFKNYYRP